MGADGSRAGRFQDAALAVAAIPRRAGEIAPSAVFRIGLKIETGPGAAGEAINADVGAAAAVVRVGGRVKAAVLTPCLAAGAFGPDADAVRTARRAIANNPAGPAIVLIAREVDALASAVGRAVGADRDASAALTAIVPRANRSATSKSCGRKAVIKGTGKMHSLGGGGGVDGPGQCKRCAKGQEKCTHWEVAVEWMGLGSAKGVQRDRKNALTGS